MGTGRPLFAKLFLECKEVPFIGATFTHAVGQAAIAYVDLIPHKLINNIKARTLVQIMVRDYSNPPKYPWVLAFEGEVFGVAFNKTPDSRSFTISCIDKSGYWDNAITYFFNAQQSLAAGAASQIGMDQFYMRQTSGFKGDAVVNSMASYFKTVIQKASTSGGDFLDGIVALYKKFEIINSFYKMAEDRLRITDRITMKSSGKLSELISGQEGRDWFENIAGKMSGFSTLRSVLQELLGIIFHDYVTLPFPSKVKASGLRKKALTGDKTIGEFVFKPNLFMLSPPACNVFFPDEYSSFTYNRNFFQEPTRLIYQPELPMAFQKQGVGLARVFEPASFDFFMRKKGNQDKGKGPLQISDSYGHYADVEPGEASEICKKKREGQFLTNEEKMKGILLAIESLTPSSSSFRTNLGEEGRVRISKRIARYLFFKKRFQTRSLQITSHLKMSVVPGFPVLILDGSDAGQDVLAYCSSVTHRIYANQGGYTNVLLSYARSPDEQDMISSNQIEPPLPPWFDEAIFGKANGQKIAYDSAGLSGFYKVLLGDKGSADITAYTNTTDLMTAVQKLTDEYRAQRSKGVEAAQTFIGKFTSRDYVSMTEAFSFLGANTAATDFNLPFISFQGFRISGGSEPNLPDKVTGKTEASSSIPVDTDEIKVRLEIVKAYREVLQKQRGFRG